MGQEKAWLELRGRPIIAALVDSLTELFGRARIIAPEDDRLARLHVDVFADLRPGCGPLGGIHTALATAQRRAVFVTGCDYPFLSSAFIRQLASKLEGYDAVVPRAAHGPVPVCAFYTVGCLPAVEASLERGQYKASSLLEELRVRWVERAELDAIDPDGLALTNLNTPEDYAKARKLVETRAYGRGRRGG